MVEETQEEMMERIKNMSPEELQEFQKSRCIFCHIVEGKVPSKKVYEDEKVIAIMDINPATKGHILVMPKEHYAIMPQIPKEILDHLSIVTKRLSKVGLQSLGAKGSNILIQNGPAAGQKAQHFMLHIIPRYDDDGLSIGLDKKEISGNEYNQIKEKVQGRINSLFGITEDQKGLDNAISKGEELVFNNTEEYISVAPKEAPKEVPKEVPKEEPQEIPEEISKEINQTEAPVQERVSAPISESLEEPTKEVEQTEMSVQETIEMKEEKVLEVTKSEVEEPKPEISPQVKEEIQAQSKTQSTIPRSRLLDMSSVNSFITQTNQDIDELKEVIEPEEVALKEFDEETKKDEIQEAEIINDEPKINHTHIENTDNIEDDKESDKEEDKKEDNIEDDEETIKSEINLDDISKMMGM